MKKSAIRIDFLKNSTKSAGCLLSFVFALIVSFSMNCHAQTHPSLELRKKRLDGKIAPKSTQAWSSSPSSYGEAYASSQFFEYIGNFDFTVYENKGEIKITVNVVITTGEENEYGDGEFVNIWIDWEGDGKFDSQDQVVEQVQFAKAVGFKGVLHYSALVKYPEDLDITDETWIRASLGYGYNPAPADSWTYGSSITKPIELGEAEFSDLKLFITGPEAIQLKSTSSKSNYPKAFGKGACVDPYYGINTSNAFSSTVMQSNDFSTTFYLPNEKWEAGKYWDNKNITYYFRAKWPGKTLRGTVELWQDNNFFDVNIGEVAKINWTKSGKSSTVQVKGELKGSQIKNLEPGSYEFRFKRIPSHYENIYNMIPAADILTPDKTLEMDYHFSIDRLPYYIQSPKEVSTNGNIEMQSCINAHWGRWGWSAAGSVTGAVTGSLLAKTTLGAAIVGGSPIWGAALVSLAGGVVAWATFSLAEMYYGTPFGWEVGDFAWYYDWKVSKYSWNSGSYGHDFDINWHRGNWYRKEVLMGYGYWSEGPGYIHKIDKSIQRLGMWDQNKVGPLDWPPSQFRNYPYYGYGKLKKDPNKGYFKNSIPGFKDPDPLIVNLLPTIYPYNTKSKFKVEKKEQYFEITVCAVDPELEWKHLTFNWEPETGSMIKQSEGYLGNAATSTIQWIHPGDGAKHKITVKVADNLGATTEAYLYLGPDGLKSSGNSPRTYTKQGILNGGILSDVSEEGVDSDNNGLLDSLILQFSIDLSALDPDYGEDAYYLVSASLLDAQSQTITSSGTALDTDSSNETIRIPFIGRDIHTHGEDGPYSLSLIQIDKISGTGMSNIAIDETRYPGSEYLAEDFESMHLSYVGNPSDAGIDNNEDGLYDQLKISVDARFDKAGTYTLSGQLYDLDTSYIATGIFNNTIDSPGISTVNLLFDGQSVRQSMVDGPYLVSNLLLFDKLQKDVNIRCEDFFTNSYQATDFQTQFAEFTGSYDEATPDLNLDGLYDSLLISAGISVTDEGLYMVSATLMKDEASLIHETSFPVNLSSGTNTVTFAIPGLSIRESGLNGPYYLANLRIEDEWNNKVYNDDFYTTDAYTAISFQIPAIILPGNYSESYQDSDNDGAIDLLTIGCDLEAHISGKYELIGTLSSAAGEIASSTSISKEYTKGMHELTMDFNGQDINLSGAEGPYTLTLSAWDTAGNMISYLQDAYTTSAYTLNQFEAIDAIITENYSEKTTDVDENGYYDILGVGVELSVSEAGEYLIRAECLDTTLTIIDEAEDSKMLEAGIQELNLDFEGKEFFKNGTDGPYILGNLFLYRIEDGSWTNLDAIDFAFATEEYKALDFQHTDAYLANEYADHGQDYDNNGLFDVLVVDVGLSVELYGSYRIEGQLYDNNGYYIETVSSEEYLDEGQKTVPFEFSGARIHGHGNASPYHLKYIRVFDTWNQLLQTANDVYTTQVYKGEQFETSEADLTLFNTELILQEGASDDNMVTLKTKVYNFGGTTVDSVIVSFYNFDLDLFELIPVYNISGGSPGLVELELELPPNEYSYTITVNIDPDYDIPELNDLNNISYIDILVPLPDFPDTPAGIWVTPGPDSVTLNWSAVSGSISGFNIYRRIMGDSVYTKLNSELIDDLAFTDTTVLKDTVYYYAITSYLVSAPSLEGAYSAEAKVETVDAYLDMSFAEYEARANDNFILPVRIEDLKSMFINSVNLKLNVNPAVLECIEASNIGTIAEGWTDFAYDCMGNGEIWISMSGSSPLPDTGTLVNIKFHVTGSVGDTSSIQINECILNDGYPRASSSSGLLHVIAATDSRSGSRSERIRLRNYPNPFSRYTIIEYTHPGLREGTRVSVDIYSLNMVKVASLDDHVQQAGKYRESWDGCDGNGNRLPSGMYIYMLKTGETTEYGRMVMID